MATVRLSKKLKEQIINNAHDMFSMRGMEAAVDEIPITVEEALELYDAAMKPWAYYAKHLPTAMLHHASRMDVSVALPGNTRYKHYKHFNHSDVGFNRLITFHETRTVSVKDSSGNVRCSVTFRRMGISIDLTDHPDNAKWAEGVQRKMALVKAHQYKKDEFIRNVRSVLDAFTTLSPALRHWPGLWDLLPANIKDKHKEASPQVQAKKKAKRELDHVDLDSMTAHVVAKKLGGT